MSGNLSELKIETGAECGVTDSEYCDEGFDCATRQTSGNRIELETDDECIDRCADLETGETGEDRDNNKFSSELLIEIDPSVEIDERVYKAINHKISQVINQIISYSLSEAMSDAIDLDGMEDDEDW
jgi:hypothetical protein